MFRLPKRKNSKSTEDVTLRQKGGASSEKTKKKGGTTATKTTDVPLSPTGGAPAPSLAGRCACCERPFGVLQSFRARRCDYCRGPVCNKCFTDRKCHRCFTKQRFDVRSVEEFRQLDRDALVRMLVSLHLPRKQLDQLSRPVLIAEILTRCGLGEQLRLYRESLQNDKDEPETKSDENAGTAKEDAASPSKAPPPSDKTDTSGTAVPDASKSSNTVTVTATINTHVRESKTPPTISATSTPTPPGGVASHQPAIDLASVSTEAEVRALTTKELTAILKANGVNQKMFSEKNEILREVIALWREAHRAKPEVVNEFRAEDVKKEEDLHSLGSRELKLFLQHHHVSPAPFPEKPELLFESVRVWREIHRPEVATAVSPKSTSMKPIEEEKEPAQTKPERKSKQGALRSEEDLRQLTAEQLKHILHSSGNAPISHDKETMVQQILQLLQSAEENAPRPTSLPAANVLTLRDIKSEATIHAMRVSELKALLKSCGVTEAERFTERYELVNLALRLWKEEVKTTQNKNRRSAGAAGPPAPGNSSTVPAVRRPTSRPEESKIVDVTSWKDKPLTTPVNQMVLVKDRNLTATPKLDNLKFRADIEKLSEQQLRSILRRSDVTVAPGTPRSELVEAVANLWLQRKHTAVSSSSSSESIDSSSSELSSSDDDDDEPEITTAPAPVTTRTAPVADDIRRMNMKQLMNIVREHGLAPTKLLDQKELAEEVVALMAEKRKSQMDAAAAGRSSVPAMLKPVVSPETTAKLEEIRTEEEVRAADDATLRDILALQGVDAALLNRAQLVDAAIKMWKERKAQRDRDNATPVKRYVGRQAAAPPPVPPAPAVQQQQQPQKVLVTMSTMSTTKVDTTDSHEAVLLSDIGTEDEIASLDLSNLKDILTQSRIRHEGFAERGEYVAEVTKLWRLQQNDSVVSGGGGSQTLLKVTTSMSKLEVPKTPAKELTLDEITSEEVIQTMHIFNLKSILQSNGQMPIGERQDLVNDVKNLWRKYQAALQMQRRERERREAAKIAAGDAPPPPSRPPAAVSRRSFLERIKASSKAPSAIAPPSLPDKELEDIRSEAEVRELSYQNLKSILVKRNVSTRRLLRKQDLQREVLSVWRSRATAGERTEPVLDDDVLLLDEIDSEAALDALSDVNLKIILKVSMAPGQRASWSVGGSDGPVVRAEMLQEVRRLWRQQGKIPTLDQISSNDEVAKLESEQLRAILKRDLHACKDKADLVVRVQFLYSLLKRQGKLSPSPTDDVTPRTPSFSPPPPEDVPVVQRTLHSITSEAEITNLSVAQLKSILQDNGLSSDHVVDKSELVEHLQTLWRQRNGKIEAPPAGTVMV